MERRNGKHRVRRGRTGFFSEDDDEIDYFSRENLMPLRSKHRSGFLDRIDTLGSKCGRLSNSGFIVAILALSILFLVSIILYHFLTAHDSMTHNHAEFKSDGFESSESKFRSIPHQNINSDYKEDERIGTDENNVIFHSKDSGMDNFGFAWQNSDEAADLEYRIKDNTRILNSVKLELIEIEKERAELQENIIELRGQFNSLLADTKREDRRLTDIYRAIEQAKLVLHELEKAETPDIQLPHQMLGDPSEINRSIAPLSPQNSQFCRLESCFDFSRCSISNGLRVYFTYIDVSIRHELDLKNIIPLKTKDPKEACLFVAVTSRSRANILVEGIQKKTVQEWHGDGRNHLIFVFDDFRSVEPSNTSELFKSIGGRYIIASSKPEFSANRAGFDFLITPLVLNVELDELWKVLPSLIPVKRQYLLSFAGRYSKLGSEKSDHEIEKISATLAGISRSKTSDRFNFKWSCDSSNQISGSWKTCYDTEVLRNSVFSIIIPDTSNLLFGEQSSCLSCQRDLVSMLSTGTIPVILGTSLMLPFEDSIDWNRAVLRLPFPRVSELHFILRSVSENDILEMRRFGRHILANYLATPELIIKSTFASLEQRLLLPSLTTLANSVAAAPVFPNGKLSPPDSHTTEMPLLESQDQEYLGPVEFPYPSPKYEHNFTRLMQSRYSLWNDRIDMLSNLPFDPFEPPPLTDIQFVNGSSSKYRPINAGEGGSGVEFSQQLGGNFPREQFTIVLLTYERESVLVSSLQRFNNMPYLNKVIVIWNSRKPPSPEIIWPKLSAPLIFVRPDKNSLNNRFLPLDQIDTEAIFSIDDDVHLTQAEIIFAFRVWRERRDQIVGFPGRFHARDLKYNSWLYNSNHSCELSMVLTGAAFFHKYYTYLYTYHMPSVIRNTVDELMNCEDLALNFLVSHVTRKPPVKVTSKWTFRCPGCPETLSADESHFTERHGCMQLFTQVYGYNPLLRTQFRADSVLFKTRLPSHCRKCFTYI